MKRVVGIFVTGACAVLLNGCAEPGESTKMGAIAGGAVGAGLGALVGSASGDAGTGLLLGATAGAGTGAFVGNALDAQNNAMRAQDEALERQERLLSAQQREVDELRKLNEDTDGRAAIRRPASAIAPRSTASRATSSSSASSYHTSRPSAQAARVPTVAERSIAVQRVAPKVEARRAGAVGEREIAVDTMNSSYTAPKETAGTVPGIAEGALSETGAAFDSYREEVRGAASLNSGINLSTPECEQAAGEIARLNDATETADKLFHARRALRLCPDNAEHHLSLAEVYQTLNRRSDAEFEVKEALRLDPSSVAAQAMLRQITEGK